MTATFSRRGFLKIAAEAGIAIKVSYLAKEARAELIETPPRPGSEWLKPSGKPRYVLDAIAKVTGGNSGGPWCGAKLSRGRGYCCSPIIYANGRCRMHGGTNPGPRTPEGKARALEALHAINAARRHEARRS